MECERFSPRETFPDFSVPTFPFHSPAALRGRPIWPINSYTRTELEKTPYSQSADFTQIKEPPEWLAIPLISWLYRAGDA